MNEQQKRFISSVDASDEYEIMILSTDLEQVILPEHQHQKYQIVYTVSGTLHIAINEKNYFIPEKHIAWIPANLPHRLTSNNTKVMLYSIYCNVAWEMNQEKSTPWDLPRTAYDQFAVFRANALVLENFKYIGEGGRTSINAIETPDLYWYTITFLRMLPTMGLDYHVPLQVLIIPEDKRLVPVLEFINQHLNEPLTLDDLAATFGFSVRNLTRIFTKSKLKFTNYLNYQRVVRAIELFSENNKIIQEVAYDVGFTTPSSFNRVFKQITGLNPTAFCNEMYHKEK